MIGWLCVSLGVAFGSSVLPIMSIELFIIGLVTTDPSIPWAAVGAVVAVGQVAGKLLYYLAAKGTIELPSPLHRKLKRRKEPSPARDRRRMRTKRLRRYVEAICERCHQHPYWMATTYGASSVLGIPPYMATTVLAGLAQMQMSVFIVLGFAGRFVRFSVLAAAPAAFSELFAL